jgi:hypothetical protein
MPGVPEVVLWKSSAQVQRTVSPGRIVTDEGEKTKLPPGATVTSTVIALAGLGYPIKETAVATTNTKRQEKMFIALPGLVTFNGSTP